MRPAPPRLAATSGLLVALGCACMGLQDDAIVYQALDYRIDRPRVLAISTDPPFLASSRTVTLDALVLAPDDRIGDGGTWSTCYLDEESWVTTWTLDCFQEGEGEVVAEGLPATWTVPSLPAAGISDTGTLWAGHQVPLLLEATVGDDTVSGVLDAFVRAQEPEGKCQRSVADLDLQVTFGEAVGGEVPVRACLGAPCTEGVFRWYVDDGTLLGTGRTAVDGTSSSACSSNTWVLPEETAGSLRVVVVVAGGDLVGCEPWGKKACLAVTPGSMTWTVATWEAP